MIVTMIAMACGLADIASRTARTVTGETNQKDKGDNGKGRITIKQIFLDNDNWKRFTGVEEKIREEVFCEVEKMLGCCDPANGYKKYQCPECWSVKVVAFRCKGRLCSRCGKYHADKWAEAISKKLYRVPHRHFVFTVPSLLRMYFRRDWKLFNVLKRGVNDTLKRVIYLSRKGKNRYLQLGVICVVHPYGKDMKFNPHVHALVTEGGLDRNLNWVKNGFFRYDLVRLTWQKKVLRGLERELKKTGNLLGSGISKVVKELLQKYRNGFYVHAPKNRLKNFKDCARYVGRYIRHPAIAESRIEAYDGTRVTFHYRKEGNGEIIHVKLPVFEFIRRLIQHVPLKQFKMISHYGLYSRSLDPAKKAKMTCINTLVPFYTEEDRARFMEGVNGTGEKKEHGKVTCDACGAEMILVEIWIKDKGIIYQKELDTS